MKYKIGNKVRIKTWEEMYQEYGITKYGDINCYCWSDNMIKYLVKEYKEPVPVPIYSRFEILDIRND